MVRWFVGWFSRAVAAAFRGGTSSRRRNNPCSSTVVLRRIIKPNDHPQILPARCPYSTLTTRPTTLAFAFCDCGDFKHIEISFCAFIGLRFWRHKTWPWPRERASLCRWNCLLSCPYSGFHQNRDRQTSPRAETNIMESRKEGRKLGASTNRTNRNGPIGWWWMGLYVVGFRTKKT